MTIPIPPRRDLLKRSGVLAVVAEKPNAVHGAPPEDALDVYVSLTDDGGVYAFNGHVDLGTGISTALAQIVAEELDVPFEAVEMVLGDTDNTPNQGPTVASETIQITAVPLRLAAAQARREMARLAAAALNCAIEDLTIEDGVARVHSAPERSASYASLLRNQRIHLLLDPNMTPKPVTEHRIVGQSVDRTDIPAKAAGTFIYVHDVRVPGMLHGRVVRPPYSGLDVGDFIGRCLESVDRQAIADVPGVVAVVVEGDFVGVVAEREEYAAEAAARLDVRWKPWTFGQNLGDLENAIRTNPSTSRKLVDEGNVDAALAS